LSGEADKPSLLLRASWGVGGLGTTSMLYLINMFVVFFLVRHVGIPAAVAGTLLAVTRLYDAIIDPTIGTLSDRSGDR
jgi:glycoside/pentoside/hexuronide:cation symporter, GPH family